MSRITIYSMVKGFEGEQDYIQRNAIGSWLALGPDVEVILFGDDEPGAREYADETGLLILSVERYGKTGAPMLRSVISQADVCARYPIRCLVHSDIILLPDFVDAIQAALAKFGDRFLLSARRWDADIPGPINFALPWNQVFRESIRTLPKSQHHPRACDLFCYRGIDWGEIPAFRFGSVCFDNWLIYRAIKEGATFVDASGVVTPVHQRHGYTIPRVQRQETAALYEQTLAANGRPHAKRYGFLHAHWLLTPGGWRATGRKGFDK